MGNRGQGKETGQVLAMLKFLSRKTVAENSRFKIHFDELEGDGIHIKDYLVATPKNFNKEGISGVGVLALYEGKVALLRIHRHAVGGEVWEIPRGFVDGEESSAVAAMRELREETGLECDPRDLISLGTVIPEAGVMNAKIAVFAATRCRMTDRREVELGFKSLEFLEWDRALGMADRSEIEDPCTIIAFFRYKRTLGAKL